MNELEAAKEQMKKAFDDFFSIWLRVSKRSRDYGKNKK